MFGVIPVVKVDGMSRGSLCQPAGVAMLRMSGEHDPRQFFKFTPFLHAFWHIILLKSVICCE